MSDDIDNTLDKILRGELSVFELSDTRCRQVLIRLVQRIKLNQRR